MKEPSWFLGTERPGRGKLWWLYQGSRWEMLAHSMGDGSGYGEKWPHLSDIRRRCSRALGMEWQSG